ncbi:MAG: tetratricopeptide repeat protein [Planctomycetota bacterium]
MWTSLPGLRISTGMLKVTLRWLLPASLITATFAVCFCSLHQKTARPPGISAEDWSAAEAVTARRLSRTPVSAEICLTLARQAIRDHQPERALACYAAIPADDPQHGLQAEFELASLLLEQARAGAAEAGFRKIVDAAGGGVAVPGRQRLIALRSLSLLYGVQMRTGQRAEILRQLMDARQADVHEAKYYFFPSLLIWQNDWGADRVRDWLKNEPNSRPLQNAAARYLIGEGRPEEARARLEVLYGADSTDLETAAFLLECCREQNDAARIHAICGNLPPESAVEPLPLTEQRGAWLMDRQEWREAEACFQRLLQRDRANPVACQGLAECCERLEQPERRQRYLERTAVLAKLRVGLGPAVPDNPAAIQAVANWCRQLEMLDAAEAFDFFAGARTRLSGVKRTGAKERSGVHFR